MQTWLRIQRTWFCERSTIAFLNFAFDDKSLLLWHSTLASASTYIPYSTIPGQHTFTRKAANAACQVELPSENSYVLNVNDTLALDITGTTSVCASSSLDNTVVTLEENNGNTTAYTYAWSTGANEGATIISGENTNVVRASWPNAGTGHLTLVVINNNTNCISRKTVAITVNEVPNPSISGELKVCQNSTDFPTNVELTTSPSNMSSYLWDYDGGTAVAGAGDYQKLVSWSAVGNHTVSVKVSDGNGCTARTTHTVSVLALPIMNVTTTPVHCNGGSDGVITVTATNGESPYIFEDIYMGETERNTTGVFEHLSASTAPHHTIIVTDNNGCQMQETSVVIDQSAEFTVMIDTVYPANCAGRNGAIKARVISDDEEPFYYFAVYNQNEERVGEDYRPVGIATEIGLPTIGSYSLKVNARGDASCFATQQFEVEVNDTLRIVSMPPIGPRCSGGEFDTLPVVNIAGTTFSWNMPTMDPPGGITGADGRTDQTSVHDEGLINNTNGNVQLTYHIEATNGYCHTTGDLVVPVGVTVQPEVTITHPDYQVCPDTRELTLTSEFGNVVNDATTVTWSFRGIETTHTDVVSTTDNTDDITVTLPDAYNTTYHYTVAFTDGVCTKSVGGDVIVPAKIELVEDNIVDVMCYEGSDGYATVHAIGGTAPYVYIMNADVSSSLAAGSSYTFYNLGVPTPTRDSTNADGATKCGDYTITITDSRNCSIDSTITICSPAQLEWLNCPHDIVVCCDPGTNVATVIPGVHFIEPTLSTRANGAGDYADHTAYLDQYPVGQNTIMYYTFNDCDEWPEDCSFTINVLASASMSTTSTSGEVNQTICSGNPIEDIVLMYANATISFEGTLPASYYTIDETSHTITISGAPEVSTQTTYTFTFTAQSESIGGVPCNTTSISGQITVKPSPTVELTSTTESCSGNDAKITATMTSGTVTPLVWVALNGGSHEMCMTNSAKEYFQRSSGIDTVTVWAYDGSTPNQEGCSVTATVEVTLDSPYPAYTFEPVTAANICSGTSFEVVPTAPVHGTFTTTYTWAAPQMTGVTGGVEETTQQDTVSGTLINEGTEVHSAVYTVTPTTGSICVGEPFTLTVPVNPTVVMNTPEDVVLCHGVQGTEIVLTSTITDGSMSYAWTNNNTAIGLAASGNGNVPSFTATNTSTTVISSTVTITPTYTNGVACSGTPVDFTITVNPQVVMNTVDNQVLCHGEQCQSVAFGSTLGNEHMTYSWTRTNETVVTGMEQAGTGNIDEAVLSNTTNTPQVTTFTVTPTYTNNGINCTGEPQVFTMTVNPKVVMNTPEDLVVCHGSENTVTFTTTLQNGETSYTWQNDNNTIGIDATGSGNTLTFTAANTGTMARVANITVTPTYTANGKSCEGEPVTFKITVNPQVVMNTPANQTLCNGNGLAVVFGTTITDGQMTYNWTRDDNNFGGLALSGEGNISASALENTADTAQTSTVTVIPTYANNNVSCTGTGKTFTITVNPSVTMDVTPATQDITFGDEITPVVITNTASEVSLSMTAEQLASIGLSYNNATQTLSGRPKAATTYTITATANSNQTPNCGSVQKTITINVAKRDLEIVIDDTKEYDGTPLTTDYTEATASALQNGATLTAGAVRTPSSNANVYTNGAIITAFATSDGIDNYNVTYNFTQEITPIDVTVTIVGANNTTVYDGDAHTVTGYTAEASTNLYNVTSVASDFTFTPAPGATLVNGEIAATRTEAGTTNMGLAADQFANTNANFGTVTFEVTDGYQTISRKTITVAADAKTKVYGNQDPTLTATVTGLQSGDPTSIISYTLNRVSGENVGTYTITPAGEADQGNYHVEYTTNTLTITPLAVNVAITGNTAMVAANGTEQYVEGFTAVADNSNYDVANVVYMSGIQPRAAGIDEGIYSMNLNTNQFTNTNANCNVTFSIAADGWLKIVPAGTVIVTITGHHAVMDYDGNEHSVSGYDVSVWVPEGSDSYTTADFEFNGTSTANRTTVGTTNMGLTANQFNNMNAAFTNVIFNVTDGYLTINKANAEVLIVGNTDINEYTSNPQTVSGYTVSTTNAAYNTASISFTGNATATGTLAGIYNMNLAANQFINNDANFNVTFNVTDGWLEIVKAGVVIVNIAGNTDTSIYNGQQHTVTGYHVVSIEGHSDVDPFEAYADIYFEEYIDFDGAATASRTNVGTTAMGLSVDDFSSNNPNFIVRFHVTDGYQTVNPLAVVVTIEGAHSTDEYDATMHSVNGYTATADTTLYTVTGDNPDFVFSGNAVASRTEVGTTNMGLAAGQFTNTNSNFGPVTFEVTDGYQTIEPINVTVTITEHSAEVDYDGTEHSVSGYDVTSIEINGQSTTLCSVPS